MVSDLAVGTKVNLHSTWGRQTRLKCVVCTRYMTAHTTTCRCGAEFVPLKTSGIYKIVRLP
jgi:hypothetical protein